MKQTFFITGTGTGVGKTVLTALLVRFLRERGANAAALKPVCSGGRDDALALHSAMNGALVLAEINPWHFRTPIAPLLAARKENRRVTLSQVRKQVRTLQRRFDVVLVEGAGGLLSPLGENFNSRDLMAALRATPIIVAPNQLGVVNQLLLTLEALPKNGRAKARIVLVSPVRPDAATASNARLLAEFFPTEKIFRLPWLGRIASPVAALKRPPIRRMLVALVR